MRPARSLPSLKSAPTHRSRHTEQRQETDGVGAGSPHSTQMSLVARRQMSPPSRPRYGDAPPPPRPLYTDTACLFSATQRPPLAKPQPALTSTFSPPELLAALTGAQLSPGSEAPGSSDGSEATGSSAGPPPFASRGRRVTGGPQSSAALRPPADRRISAVATQERRQDTPAGSGTRQYTALPI